MHRPLRVDDLEDMVGEPLQVVERQLAGELIRSDCAASTCSTEISGEISLMATAIVVACSWLTSPQACARRTGSVSAEERAVVWPP